MHPVCGTCAKNGTECVYDGESRREEAASRGFHGLQWQGQAQQTSSEEPTSEPPSADMRFGQMGIPNGEGSGIVSQMDKVISTIERLDEERNRSLGGKVAAVNMDNSNTGSAPVNDHKERLQSASSRPTSPLTLSTASINGNDYPVSSGKVTDLADSMENLDLGHLILEDDGRSRLVTSLGFPPPCFF